MKIAIMSDSHDRWDHLESAINIANQNQCEYLLFAGDLIAPPGISILEKFAGKVIFIWGNNEGEKMGMTRMMDASEKITLHNYVYEGVIDQIKIHMNHYPEPEHDAASSDKYDLCVFGHTHETHQETIGNTLLVNPGEIQGYKTGKSTFMIYDSSTKKAEVINTQ